MEAWLGQGFDEARSIAGGEDDDVELLLQTRASGWRQGRGP